MNYAEARIRADGDESRDERTRQILEFFEDAEAHRKDWEDDTREWYRLYCGFVEIENRLRNEEGLDLARIDPADLRSNLFIPRTYLEVATLRSRIIKSFFAARPYIEFLPTASRNTTPEMLEAAMGKAKLAAALVDYQLERTGIFPKFYDYTTNIMICPAGIMRVSWCYQTRMMRKRVPYTRLDVEMVPDPMTGQPMPRPVAVQVPGVFRVVMDEEVVYDDNDITIVDWWDWWPDPFGRDIDHCRYCFERVLMTWRELEEYLGMLQELGSGDVYELDREQVIERGRELAAGQFERLTARGFSTPTDRMRKDDPKRLVEVLLYWEDEVHALIVNRASLAYFGENPYWRHSLKPYVVQPFEPLHNELYGLSAAQFIEHLQDELNTTRNQRIDVVSFLINRPWLVEQGMESEINEADLIITPNKIIPVPNLDKVRPMDPIDVPASAYQEEAAIKRDMEDVLGVPPVAQGMPEQSGTTATEIAQRASNVAIRYEIWIALFEWMGFKRMARLMDLNNQQLVEESRLVPFWDGQAIVEWKNADVEQILGEFDYRPTGTASDPGANREVCRKEIMEAVQFLQNLGVPFFKDKAAKMVLDNYDVRGASTLIIPRDMWEQALAAAQEFLMAQMGGQLPAGGTT